jgi:nucleotide-binding universal stress UspA family protein
MNVDKNKILVPVDFTEVSNAAIQHATLLAKQINGEINLLHVIEKPFIFIGRKNRYEDQIIEAGTQNRLQELADRIEKEENLQTDILAVQGNIFDTITAVASEIGANFVVMGTHGVKGIQHLTGSNALKVIYHSPVPFMLTQSKGPANQMYDNIVFPLDSQHESIQKTDWAIFFSNKFNSKINILIPTETDSYLAKRVKNNLGYVKSKFEKFGISYTVNVSTRDSAYLADETNRYTAEINANLILIMIYPSRGAGEFFITPAQQKMISNPNEIPVMCINPGALFTLQTIA